MAMIRPPFWLPWIYAGSFWKIKTNEPVVYLTFDDGPIPEVTPWVLDQLAPTGIKATFFCIGKNVKANPEIYERILSEGHNVGNHTMNHVKGWKTPFKEYVSEVNCCAALVKSKLFRPPYGRISFRQFYFLKRHFKVVFWDVLSADYDPAVSADQCVENVIDNIRAGSVIVFHDSLKAGERLKIALPIVLEKIRLMGLRFELIDEKLIV